MGGACSGSDYVSDISRMEFVDLNYTQVPSTNGVTGFDGRGQINPSSIWSQVMHQEYGGWLDHVMFFAQEADFWRGGQEGPPARSVVQAFVLGDASPASPLTGSST